MAKYLVLPLKNVIFLPSIVKPLQLTEPDHSLILNYSLSQNLPMALCYLPEGEKQFLPIAGYGMPQVVEHRDEHNYLIFIKCLGKVNILLNTINIENGCLVAEGEACYDDLSLSDRQKTKYISLSHVLARWIQQHIHDINQQKAFLNNLTTPTEVVSAFATYLVYDYDLQYEIQSLAALNEKIEILYRLLESGKLL